MGLREAILAAEDIGEQLVTVPEWKVDVLVRGLDGADRALLLDAAFDHTTRSVNLQTVYPDLVMLCSYDPESKERVFDPAADREFLMAKAATAIDKVAMVAMKLSGFSDEAVDQAGKDS